MARALPIGLLCLLMSAPALAERTLMPADLLVVVNANAGHSEELGKYYCLARNVPPEQLLVLHCDPAAICSRIDYDRNIAGPIRQFLLQQGWKDKIKCIVLMWGVPVRVLGPELPEDQKQALATWRTQMERMAGRLVGAVELLKTVGVRFPTPKANTLNVNELFDAKVSVPTENNDGAKAASQFSELLKKKTEAVAALTDPSQKEIARRQLAALQLEILGLKGFLANWPAEDLRVDVKKADLEAKIEAATQELSQLPLFGETADIVREKTQLQETLCGPASALNLCAQRANDLDTLDEDASVDSELSLVWHENYNLHGQLPNPLNWRLEACPPQSRPASLPANTPETPMVMCCRIDGPSPADALRIIKDSIWCEQNGLKGTFYIDAGGKYPEYDVKAMKPLGEFVKKQTHIPLVYDSSRELFPPDSCPDAALYIGWYSLQHYIPSLTLNRGAVGWHVASLEAMHLRTASCQEWCPKLIQNGIAATMGAVNEPFLGAFPVPLDFFALLLTGDYTIAECYWRSVPTTSWRLTLIADPLYNPYRLHPVISVHRLPTLLAGQEKLDAIDK